MSKILIKTANDDRVKWFSAALLTVAVFAYYPAPLDIDYDVWFHLKYGEHFIDNLTWNIDHAMFSWTPVSSNWKYVTWIGSSALYLIYNVASMPGLCVFRFLILLSVFGICFYYVKSMGNDFDINHIMGLMLVFIALNLETNFFKPELFTVVFFALSVFIFFYSKSLSKNLFFIYPPLFLIWVNTHGGFIFGLFLINLLLCGEILNFLFLKKQAMPKTLLINLAFSVAFSYMAILINPYGIYYHTGLFKEFFQNDFLDNSRVLLAYSNMWDHLFPKTYIVWFVNTAWTMLLMAVLFFLLVVYAFRKERYFDITVFVINAVFFYLGMKISRATLFFPLIWFLSSVYVLKKIDGFMVKKKFAAISLLLFISSSGIVLYDAAVYTHPRTWFGTNLDELAPVREADFIKRYKLPGPVFNDYITGAYLMWALYPEYKVFIDPRFGPYEKEVWPDFAELGRHPDRQQLEKFTGKYNFRTAIINLNDLRIIFLLLSRPDWRLVYFDKVAAVLVSGPSSVQLPAETLSADLSANRFKDVDNPQVLGRLFGLYCSLETKYGPAMLYNAAEICHIYRSNVSDLYKFKKSDLREMEGTLTKRKLLSRG